MKNYTHHININITDPASIHNMQFKKQAYCKYNY